jgi:mannan endo-1,6-alpha-mannosidase
MSILVTSISILCYLLTTWQTTGDTQSKWGARVTGLLNENKVFFSNGTIMYEVACEPSNNCNVDQLSFKAYLSRWMAATTKVAPWTADQILPLLASSAQAAALSCSGGDGAPIVCGTKWTTGAYDGITGVGQQMSALEVIQSNLIKKVAGPVSNSTGGTSQGNPSAGTGSSSTPVNAPGAIKTKDKAGAGILTAILVIGSLGGGYVSVLDEILNFGTFY